MPSASAIRFQVEAALAQRIPSALTQTPKMIRPVAATGVQTVDELLDGGLPIGAITEIAGPECSGRSSLALSFLAQITQAAKVCAWVDVSNAFHPESAAATGVNLSRLLWVRCGVSASEAQHSPQTGFPLSDKCFVPPPIKRGLHCGGFGTHPRGEAKGLSDAVSGLLQPEAIARRCAEPQRRVRQERTVFEPQNLPLPKDERIVPSGKPWSRLDQALRVTDLLLQGGGFSAIVLDMGSIAPEYTSRVPLATWFRYRAAAENTQASVLLLTQHSCATSSAGLVLRLKPSDALREERTVFTGVEHRVEAVRQRFGPTSTNVISLRKPVQRENAANWQSRTTWAGRR